MKKELLDLVLAHVKPFSLSEMRLNDFVARLSKDVGDIVYQSDSEKSRRTQINMLLFMLVSHLDMMNSLMKFHGVAYQESDSSTIDIRTEIDVYSALIKQNWAIEVLFFKKEHLNYPLLFRALFDSCSIIMIILTDFYKISFDKEFGIACKKMQDIYRHRNELKKFL